MTPEEARAAVQAGLESGLVKAPPLHLPAFQIKSDESAAKRKPTFDEMPSKPVVCHRKYKGDDPLVGLEIDLKYKRDKLVGIGGIAAQAALAVYQEAITLVQGYRKKSARKSID